jgi:hypothetical protein
MISCHALANTNTPQTLNIEGYIKNKKVMVFIDSGSTHNFINYKFARSLNCFVLPRLEFEVMIADGGTINCLRKCHSINLNMREYLLNNPMISIQMGGVDVVLGVKWLMSVNFQDLCMIFSSKENKIKLRVIQGKLSKVIISNSMKTLIRKGHHVVITQLCSLDVQTSISSSLVDLQIVITNHLKVFGEIPKGI